MSDNQTFLRSEIIEQSCIKIIHTKVAHGGWFRISLIYHVKAPCRRVRGWRHTSAAPLGCGWDTWPGTAPCSSGTLGTICSMDQKTRQRRVTEYTLYMGVRRRTIKLLRACVSFWRIKEKILIKDLLENIFSGLFSSILCCKNKKISFLFIRKTHRTSRGLNQVRLWGRDKIKDYVF